uniref:Abhydrolase domain-containing protein 3 n=1 Tax=Phallusia mammillata TaxID=59560 RepID=A0A6F9D6B3_9ASCI|nr:abhydrolase domain-containing protein 3 [Phallusia mammillata]
MALSPTAVLVSSFLFYCGYYFMHYGKQPQVYKKKTSKFSHFLDNYVTTLVKPFWSFFVVPGGRFQTIVAALLPRDYKVSYYRKENISTPDGGEFLLAWASPGNKDEPTKPLVVIFPGLVSRSTSGYVQIIVKELIKLGFSAVVMGNRGIEIPCQTGKAFCAADTNDMQLAVNTIRERYPNRLIAGVGISFGGLLLSRYLAQKGENSKLQAAFVYCCPFNPVAGSVNLEKWDNWLLYNVFLTNDLLKIYDRSREKFVGVVDHQKLKRVRSIREFDIHMTAKVFGYESVDHYYKDSVITTKFLHSIKTPTLCLCADDDAFVPIKSLPYQEMAQTDYIAIAITHGGGHVGHLQGINPLSTPYFVEMMMDYFTAVFNHSDELPEIEKPTYSVQ